MFQSTLILVCLHVSLGVVLGPSSCTQGPPISLLDSTLLPIGWRVLNPPSTYNFQHTFGFSACPSANGNDSICILPTNGTSDPLISALEVQIPTLPINDQNYGWAFDVSMTIYASSQDAATESGLGMAFGIMLDPVAPGYGPFGPSARYSSGCSGGNGVGNVNQPLLTAMRFADQYTCLNYPSGMYGGAAGCYFFTGNVTTTQRVTSPVVANYVSAKFYWSANDGLLYLQQMSINQSVLVGAGSPAVFDLPITQINASYNMVGCLNPPSRMVLYSERTNISVSHIKLTYSDLECSTTTSSSTSTTTTSTTKATTLTTTTATTTKQTTSPTTPNPTPIPVSTPLPPAPVGTTSLSTPVLPSPIVVSITTVTPNPTPHVITTGTSTLISDSTDVVVVGATNATLYSIGSSSHTDATSTTLLILTLPDTTRDADSTRTAFGNSTANESTSQIDSTAADAQGVVALSGLMGLNIGVIIAIVVLVLICVVLCAILLACRRSLRKNYCCNKFCSIMPVCCNNCFPCVPPEKSDPSLGNMAIASHIQRVLAPSHVIEIDEVVPADTSYTAPSLPPPLTAPSSLQRKVSVVYDRVIFPDEGYSAIPNPMSVTGYDIVKTASRRQYDGVQPLPIRKQYDGVESHLD
jgi:hypothetical protein